MCFALQWRALFRHLNFQKWPDHVVFCTFWLRNVLRATRACTFSTSQLPKVVQTWCVLYILTSKCASRHSSMHFFDISTSKSGPNMVCFVHFDFEMCFAPQRRALFHMSTSKSGPNMVCFVHFDLYVLRAKTACTFPSLIWPAGSAPAALASLLFNPPEPQIIGKTQSFATFLPFRAPASSFFWLFLFSDLLFAALLFSSLTLTTSAFHLSILSEVWLLNFLRISYIPMNTNSTAQGGGGSFKNRKPIGEVGCCYSRMAERIHGWTERWLISLTLSLSFALFLSLSLSFSNYLPTYLPTYRSICLSIDLSISLSLSHLSI